MQEDDAKYKEVINILKGLPAVSAPKNFETELIRKINAGEAETKLSFWDRIFLPSRLIPSVALGVTAVIILFVMNINSSEIDNPLLVEPRVREDVVANTDDISLKNEYSVPIPETNKQSKDKFRSKEMVKSDKATNLIAEDSSIADEILSKKNKAGISMETSVTTASFIDKKGLNYRQVNLSKEEKIIVNELKERVFNNTEN